MGFKKIPFTLYTYVLAKILQNGAKFIQKLTPGFKNHMRNLNNFRQAMEIPISKLKFDGLLSKKYIPSHKTYTEDLPKITFSYLCENSPNYSCNSRNPKSFFTTQLLCMFLAQTLHIFHKSTTSKWKFSDFSLLRLKFTKFLMLFFKWKVSFSSKFGSFFSVMGDHSSVLYRLKLYMLLAKVAHKCANFQTYHCPHLKVIEFLKSFLEPRFRFSSNFVSLFSVIRRNSSVLFHLNICILWKNGSNQSASFQTLNCSHEN